MRMLQLPTKRGIIVCCKHGLMNEFSKKKKKGKKKEGKRGKDRKTIYKCHMFCQACSPLGKLNWEDCHTFKASLYYTSRPCVKNKNKN